ncbi:hypothetical protein BGZ49_002817, partial [Haplosporangium sp. Z 27]
MTSTLYRFTTAQGLVRLLDKTNAESQSIAPSSDLHGNLANNDNSMKNLFSFDHLVCDFDETITDHDTTSSFDDLASKIRPEEYPEPQMTWSEILQAYLDDLEKVKVSDLCHLNTTEQCSQRQECNQQHDSNQKDQDDNIHRPKPEKCIQLPSTKHHLLDPKVRELQCHIDGRTFTPEPELPTPKIPALQSWIHSQVRKRAVEKVSLDRVYESGNLVGLTKAQIREYGREHIRLRPGMVEFLKEFVNQQDKKEAEGRRKGELWVVSVNWSQDLIRGALDQVFGSEEATEKYLPDSNLISSNLQFMEEDHHEMIQRRRRSSVQNVKESDNNESTVDKKDCIELIENSGKGSSDSKESDKCSSLKNGTKHLSNGKVKVHCLTGTDKLHAFQKIQRDYAAKHNIKPDQVKWAYLGDSSTDLGCLVEADVGIIIGKSKSLITECEQSGIRVIDMDTKSE